MINSIYPKNLAYFPSSVSVSLDLTDIETFKYYFRSLNFTKNVKIFFCFIKDLLKNQCTALIVKRIKAKHSNFD